VYNSGMSAIASSISLDDQQHLVLEDMSWEFYEKLLKEIGDRHIRVTFDDGRMEIMSPLPRHEWYGEWIGHLLILMCVDLSIRVQPLGSTTFRAKAKKKGLEPDRCYYVRNADAVAKMGREFNANVDPPPDLAVEIDITSRSVPREPIYAELGVPELWRYDATGLHVLHLTRQRKYARRKQSLAFPFLPMDDFAAFIPRMHDEDQLRVFKDFRAWIASLPS
jgi:Uma2 family endonuclease